MPSLYRYSWRGGSGDAVRSEVKTRLNDVVKVCVSIAQSARASERKSDDLGSISSRDTDFLLSLTLTALRVSVTTSHSSSFIYPPRVICFSQ